MTSRRWRVSRGGRWDPRRKRKKDIVWRGRGVISGSQTPSGRMAALALWTSVHFGKKKKKKLALHVTLDQSLEICPFSSANETSSRPQPSPHPTLSVWVEQACGLPCSLPEHRSCHKDRHAEDTMGWGGSQACPESGLCAISLYYPCARSHRGDAVLPLIPFPPPPPFHLLHSARKTQLSLLSLLSDVLTPTEIRRMRDGWVTAQWWSRHAVRCTWTTSSYHGEISDWWWLCEKWINLTEGLIWSALSSWTGIDLIDGMVLRQWPALIFLFQRSLILSTSDRSVIDFIDQKWQWRGVNWVFNEYWIMLLWCFGQKDRIAVKRSMFL